MQKQFLQKFYDKLFQEQLHSFSQDPFFKFSDVLINVSQRIHHLCNNSKIAISTFCQYILTNIISSNTQLHNNLTHPFIVKLKLQDNCIILFTKIAVRIFLLSYFCKLGEDSRRNEWKKGLKQLIKQAKIQFMFNYHQSLATMLVNLINRIQNICNQLSFYQNLIYTFSKYDDLDFTINQIKFKITKTKQQWKQNLNTNKIELTPNLLQKQKIPQNSSDATQNINNTRKSIQIIKSQQKQQQSQVLRKRISDFRQDQKKRFSEHFQSSKKRTLFYQRKFIKKIDQQKQSQQSQMFLFQDHQPIPKQMPSIQNIKQSNPLPILPAIARISSKVMIKQSLKSNTKTSTQQTDIDDYIVPGTPPKINQTSSIEKK